VSGTRVAYANVLYAKLFELLFSNLRLLQGFTLRAQLLERRDTDNVSFLHFAEAVNLQDDVESLIPRNVDQAQRNFAGNVFRRHDVEVRNLSNDAERVVDIGVLQVERDQAAVVLLILNQAAEVSLPALVRRRCIVRLDFYFSFAA